MPPHSAVDAQMTFFLYILQRYPVNKECRISYTAETPLNKNQSKITKSSKEENNKSLLQWLESM
jgi:hypothetical protein